jgi:hypothetical protein
MAIQSVLVAPAETGPVAEIITGFRDPKLAWVMVREQ